MIKFWSYKREYKKYSNIFLKKIKKTLDKGTIFFGDQLNLFENYLNGNRLSIGNMFITKTYFFKNYCENIFPWLNKCLEYCNKNNIFNDKNIRLPIFLTERYTSYWFSENVNTKYLCFARLRQFLLSNNMNKFVNPIKIPFTFRMYSTLHDY